MRKITAFVLFILMAAIVVVVVSWKGEQIGVLTSVPPEPDISARQAILIDGQTGKTLYEKNGDEKAYPASTTKIMTGLLVLETLEKYQSPLDQKVTVPDEAVGIEGSSLYLRKGEKVYLEDLLYGMMLHSGNDAAVALSVIAAGDRDVFVEKMNRRAAELHCRNTHFRNPEGLYDDDHYTTARDMAIIAREAMGHREFRKIVAARSWDAERERSTFTHFRNKNKTVWEFKGGNGIKIGFTQASGRTLVASSERDGKALICVVMGAPNWFNDAYTLMEYGFKRMEE